MPKRHSKKERIIYQEKYKDGVRLLPLPVLKHLNPGFVVSEAQLLEVGVSVKNGISREYNIIKVYVEEDGVPKDPG